MDKVEALAIITDIEGWLAVTEAKVELTKEGFTAEFVEGMKRVERLAKSAIDKAEAT